MKRLSPSRARFRRQQWIRWARRAGYSVDVWQRAPGTAPLFLIGWKCQIALALPPPADQEPTR